MYNTSATEPLRESGGAPSNTRAVQARLLLWCVVASALLFGLPEIAGGADNSGYRVGDRLPQQDPAIASAAYKELPWNDLVPKDWDPGRAISTLNMDSLDDADPRAIKALAQLRTALDNAPVVPSLNGARVRIPGFLVPLESQRGQISEFLLVPYFGACIHTPPPPANQIIHVFPAKPLKGEVMDAVWVTGVLETTRSETGMGAAGYRLKADVVTPYKK